MALTPFIDATDLSDYIGRDVTADDGATIAVDAACHICRDVAEQSFNKVSSDKITVDGSGTDALVLPGLPATRVSKVTVDGVEVTDYTADLDRGLLLRIPESLEVSPVWERGRQNVQVTYDHGFTDVPASVRMVALAIATRLVVQGANLQEQVGETSVRYAVASTDLTAGEQLILRRYRGA